MNGIIWGLPKWIHWKILQATGYRLIMLKSMFGVERIAYHEWTKDTDPIRARSDDELMYKSRVTYLD